jgi:hypothetical protein
MHVTCFVEKAGFESRTLGTKVERYDHCATRPVDVIDYWLYLSTYPGSVRLKSSE